MSDNMKIIAILDTKALPSDCFDINVHVKNVDQGLVTNETEQLLYSVKEHLLHAGPRLGKTSFEWSWTEGSKVTLTLTWR